MDPTGSLSESFADLSVGNQNAPCKPTTLLARVSCERDLFINNDHNLVLNAKLMRHFRAFRRLNEVPDLPALLSIVTLGDKQLVTLTEEEAEELLTSQPSITLVLQKAWKEESFKEV